MRYCVIEGIDTSGKTTQCSLIRQHYKCATLLEAQEDSEIILLNEPGGTEFGQLVRDILLHRQVPMAERSTFLLFLAQRADIFSHIAKLAAKDSHHTIIADRSLLSGIAYASNLDIFESIKLNLFATYAILPHKIVFLELGESTLKERLSQKTLDNIEQKGIEYLMEIQARFKQIFALLQQEESLQALQQYCNAITHRTCTPQAQSITIAKPEILCLDAALPKEVLHKRIHTFFGI